MCREFSSPWTKQQLVVEWLVVEVELSRWLVDQIAKRAASSIGYHVRMGHEPPYRELDASTLKTATEQFEDWPSAAFGIQKETFTRLC